MGRFVILSGPSCAGKGPLCAALRKFYPELAGSLQPVVLYNSRDPRPHEVDGVDYHFRPRAEIEALRERDGFSVLDVRGDLQALDHGELAGLLEHGDALFEGNPFVGQALLEVALPPGINRISAFLAPLCAEEIRHLRAGGVDLAAFLTGVQRCKLLRRTTKQKEILSLKDLENIEKRAASAWAEVCLAPAFGWVIPNHDAEGSENWDQFYHPIGDARKALLSLAALLRGEDPPFGERWPAALFA